jgi:hypothetical protein
MAEDWTPPADAPRTKAGDLKHTCRYAPSGPPFRRYNLTEDEDCARCDEMRHGGEARRPDWVEYLGSTTRRAAQDAEERRRHFAPGGPHATGKCGPVCTAFDW